MTSAELSALSDKQLSERVAVEVAGLEPGWSGGTSKEPNGWRFKKNGAWQFVRDIPPFASSADAVLPLTESIGSWSIDSDRIVPESIRFRIILRKWGISAEGPTIPRTISIALLLAKGTK